MNWLVSENEALANKVLNFENVAAEFKSENASGLPVLTEHDAPVTAPAGG